MIESPKEYLISIIIPVYNRAGLIGNTLDSVLAQIYTNWECIVVDDGSTDNTKEVVQRYVDKDPRFILVDRPEKYKPGGNGARNYGFEISKGAYIQWFDSDDVMHEHHLEEKVNYLIANPEKDYVVCKVQFVRNGEVFGHSNIVSDDLLYDFVRSRVSFMVCGPLWEKCFLSNGKLFNESLKRHQESEFYLRLLLRSDHYGIIDKPLISVFFHKTNKSLIDQTNEKYYHYFVYFLLQIKTLKRAGVLNKNKELLCFLINRQKNLVLESLQPENRFYFSRAYLILKSILPRNLKACMFLFRLKIGIFILKTFNFRFGILISWH